jgi:hypothetical protein
MGDENWKYFGRGNQPFQPSVPWGEMATPSALYTIDVADALAWKLLQASDGIKQRANEKGIISLSACVLLVW